MAFRIDQAGLATGVVGRSRTDGLRTGAKVTLTNFGGGTTLFRLLWVPPGDTSAVSSLAPTAPGSAVWEFTPTAERPGTYLIELIENQGLPSESVHRRVFRVRTANRGLAIPALNEWADPRASLVNAGPDVVERSYDNATDYAGSLSSLDYAGWLRLIHELVVAVDATSTGGVSTIVDSDSPGLAPATGAVRPLGGVLGYDAAGVGTWQVQTPGKVYHVGSGYGMYPTITAALAAAVAGGGLTADTRALILVWPGLYVSTAPYALPQYVTIRGVNRTDVILENSTTNLFTLNSDVEISNLTIKGHNVSGLVAFDNGGTGTSRITFRSITMAGATHCQQKFCTFSGTVWQGVLIKDCLIFSTRVSGSTLDFTANGDRFTNVYIEDTQIDNYAFTSAGQVIRFIAGKGNRLVRVRLRGAQWFTGVSLENGGVNNSECRLVHCYIGGDGFDGDGVGVAGQLNTHYWLINTDAAGSTTSGTRTCRNSFPAS